MVLGYSNVLFSYPPPVRFPSLFYFSNTKRKMNLKIRNFFRALLTEQNFKNIGWMDDFFGPQTIKLSLQQTFILNKKDIKFVS